MKVIVTKYATGGGVEVVEGGEPAGGNPLLFRQDGEFGGLFRGRDWHKTRAEAKADVLLRFKRQRESLEKQLAHLDERRRQALKVVDEAEL